MDLGACAQLSPATPPSTSQAVAQQITPQSKLRTQQLLQALPVPSSPPPAAVPGAPCELRLAPIAVASYAVWACGAS